MSRKLTREEIVEKCILRNGDKYSYDKVIADVDDIIVTCAEHGDFLINRVKHMHRGDGCHKCTGKGMSLQDVIDRFVEIHGDTYDYSDTRYDEDRTRIAIRCRIHGEFWQRRHHHMAGKGCSECANRNMTTEKFIARARDRHGDTYGYSKAVYSLAKTPLVITCKIHGDFKQAPFEHVNSGQGCPSCSKSGYRPNLHGTFYILSDGEITKIGITNRDVNVRVREINRSSKKNFTTDIFIKFEDGQIALDIENSLLRELAQEYQKPTEVFSGSTECFLNIDKSLLLSRVIQTCAKFLNNKQN